MIQLKGLTELRQATARYDIARRLHSLMPMIATTEEWEESLERITRAREQLEKAQQFYNLHNNVKG